MDQRTIPPLKETAKDARTLIQAGTEKNPLMRSQDARMLAKRYVIMCLYCRMDATHSAKLREVMAAVQGENAGL